MAYPKIPPFTLYSSHQRRASYGASGDAPPLLHIPKRSASPDIYSVASYKRTLKSRRKQVHDVLVAKFRSKFDVFRYP